MSVPYLLWALWTFVVLLVAWRTEREVARRIERESKATDPIKVP